MAKTSKALVEAARSLIEAASSMGLTINGEKTKDMYTGPGDDSPLIVEPHIFKKVKEFTYLGTLVTSGNNMAAEIRKRLTAANRCYFGLLKTFRSRFVTTQTKLVLYKTLVRPVLTYASQTWTVSKHDEKDLLIFERKILRRIIGLVRDGTGWRVRKNRELYKIYDEPDIVKMIKLGRLGWAGHVARME